MPRPGRTALLDPGSGQVETTIFRAVAVLRFVVAGYVVALNAARWREFDHPVAGWLVVAGVVAWTFVAAWAYDTPGRRGLPLLVLDVLVAAAALLSTRFVESDEMLARTASTIPSYWVIAAVLAWAVMRGWPGGIAAAVLISLADLSVRDSPTGTTWGNIFLLLLAGGVVGYSADLIREATEARAEAERLAAAMAERARLARAVHDGVLQVLSLVQRRATEAGGDAAELGRLAGEQEVRLRALVQGTAPDAASVTGVTGDGRSDLVDALNLLASRTVTVSLPAGPVLLPDPVVHELTSVVRACLDNVTRHVGPDASAWVLLEQVPGGVLVSVRDEGPGIADGRLEQARDEGRLGVSESIRGRMADLGGTAQLTTAPGQGVEWELDLPVEGGSG